MPITSVRAIFVRFLFLTALLSLFAGGMLVAPGSAQDATEFPNLDPAQPVMDQTGTSLTPEQIADLFSQIEGMAGTGAEVVLLVRNLDATPDETLDQVEALQQAWVADTGSNQDTTIAILINRNPDDAHDARAGIYVGRTYHEGNIPEDEQLDIVGDVLIPPLREGDVFASFSDTLTRVQDDILHGPPQSAFERWSKGASGWLPWVSATLAAGAAGISAVLFQRRQTIHQPAMPPTTIRPDSMISAIAGALVAGSPQPSAFPATVLDLAARGALRIEPESEGGAFTKPKIRVRLLDQGLALTPEEQLVWDGLQRRSDVGLVSSKNLPRAASDDTKLKQQIMASMRERGWLDVGASGPKAGLIVLALIALAGALGIFIVTLAAGGDWRGFVSVGLLVAAGILGFVLYGNYSGLSQTGQAAAVNWKAYRDGLRQAAKDDALPLNLDEALPDAVAFNLGSDIDKRMKTAVEGGESFRAFSAATTSGQSGVVIFPWWIAYNSSIATASGSGSGSTVSGGGAGGGGGAAGST